MIYPAISGSLAVASPLLGVGEVLEVSEKGRGGK
jgi:hypothetical protein